MLTAIAGNRKIIKCYFGLINNQSVTLVYLYQFSIASLYSYKSLVRDFYLLLNIYLKLLN